MNIESSALGILNPMPDAALDRLIATVESLDGPYARAKDDGDPAALDLIEQLRTR